MQTKTKKKKRKKIKTEWISDHLKCKIAQNATQQRVKNQNQRSNKNSYQQPDTHIVCASERRKTI